jgi:hypothetical protein
MCLSLVAVSTACDAVVVFIALLSAAGQSGSGFEQYPVSPGKALFIKLTACSIRQAAPTAMPVWAINSI